MTWIKTIPYFAAEGALKKIYHRIKGPNDQVDQILQAHSLRPHTLKGHMALYKNALHHRGNTLPKWYLESIGVYVSLINQCDYCVDHHLAGLKRLVSASEFARLQRSLQTDLKYAFSEKHQVGLRYAEVLTRAPAEVMEATIVNLRSWGFSDGEILEINQVTAYFNYANRTVLGLGVSTDGEKLGQSPSADDAEDWGHE